jgi:hypothetical protein
MDLHVLHDEVALEVTDERPGRPQDLSDLLGDLSFVRERTSTVPGRLVLSVHVAGRAIPLPGGHAASHPDTVRVEHSGDDAYVTDGASLLHVEARCGRATAQIAPSFDARPLPLRHRFWAYGITKLLRQQGLFALHAGGVSTPRGDHLLLVGPSGSGKSTITIGLIRAGGRFLSDDAVLLRTAADGIEALTFRRPFSIDAARAADYADLVGPVARPQGSRAHKRRADALRTYRSQSLQCFRPRAIIFPCIVAQATSDLRELSRAEALSHLLAQSGPELFDGPTMSAHLDVLGRLLRQTTPYELRAGQDLHRAPELLADLLEHTMGAAWPGSSSN